MRARRERQEGALNRLYGLLVDVKEQWKKTEFIPDANSTLRLTYGYVKGYMPADATFYSPITTLSGVLEKTTGQEPFNTPQKIVDLAAARLRAVCPPEARRRSGRRFCITLTRRGQLRKAALNAYGELVGVNFDRAWEATINDYAWSESTVLHRGGYPLCALGDPEVRWSGLPAGRNGSGPLEHVQRLEVLMWSTLIRLVVIRRRSCLLQREQRPFRIRSRRTKTPWKSSLKRSTIAWMSSKGNR